MPETPEIAHDAPPTTSGRAVARFVARLVLFGIALALGAELFFRTVVPAAETPIVWQDDTLRLRRFDPTGPRDGQWTSGRRAEQRATWHINNLGWNCPFDYLPDNAREKPVLAFAGDSQFEGMYIDWPDHIAARVAARTDGRSLGYSFASSGYKLSQYILVARHLAAEHITPKALILFINQGDFDQSLAERGGAGSTDQLRLQHTDSGMKELLPANYGVTPWRRAMRQSALARYLVFNARLNPWNRGPVEFAMREQGEQPEDNALADPLYVEAFDYSVGEMRKALPKTRLVFLVDADRASLYRQNTRPATLGTSPLIEARCPALGCELVDLTDAFTAAYLADGGRLNYEHNFHWNPRGHDVAAEAVLQRLRPHLGL